MTVIEPNSISGITSITAQANEINVFRHDGVLAGLQLNGVNHHTSSGVSTFHTLNVLGNVSVGGTLTYEDVTNIDSIGIITARQGVRLGVDGTSSANYISVGAGDDLKIWHQSSNNHSYISETGSGSLILDGSKIRLRLSGSTQFETDTNGIIATGSAHRIVNTSSGDCELIIEADTTNSNETDNPRILFRQDGGQNFSAIGTNDNVLEISNSVGGGGISFKTGTTNGYTNAVERLTIDGSGILQLSNSTNPSFRIKTGSLNRLNITADTGNNKVLISSQEGYPLTLGAASGGGSSEALRIDSSGRIILGSSVNNVFTTVSYRKFQIGQADGGWINLARTGTPADGNHLGAIQGFARGADGNYNDTVAIDFKADGTPSNTSKPSKIEFYTTKSGTTSKAIAATLQASGRSEVFVQQQQLDIYSTGSGEQHSLRLLNSDASAGNEIGIYFGPANNVAGAYISGYAYGDFASTANRDAGLRFGVRQNGTFKEVVRINDGGFFQATNIEGNYETHTFAADLGHQFNSNQRYKTTLWLRNTNANFENGMFRCAADRGANTAYHFITCTSGDLSDDEFRVRGDGKVYGDNNYTVGADYAEYFEWSDGNTSNQDRRGMTVVLDGNKVKLSTSSDSADNIIGVVSGSPSVVGDSSWSAWSQKYLKDDYNQYILDSDGYRQLNSSYDDTKTYTPRAERQEWDAIGMVGKLRIVKGQKTGTRWIKMRDISDTVEEWLVR